MLPEQAATRPALGPDAAIDARRRQRFGLVLAVVLGLIATAIAYFGTRDAWMVADRAPDAVDAATAGVPADPAWDIELPPGPHLDEFQTSCLICHSARLPFGQPPFSREQWGEIVHKMAAVYGAPVSAENEANIVVYLLAVRRPAP